jgi:hypothetical protein
MQDRKESTAKTHCNPHFSYNLQFSYSNIVVRFRDFGQFRGRAIVTHENYEDESLAPPVDDALLTALVRRELSRDEARDVYKLIYAFESWNAAHTRILIAEFRKSNQDESDTAE